MDLITTILALRESKDIDNYRTVRRKLPSRSILYRFDIVDGKLNIQFNEGEPYFEGIDIAKPKVKMTAFKFDNKTVTELTLNEFMIHKRHYDANLNYIHETRSTQCMYL